MAGPEFENVLTPQEIAAHLCDAGRIDRTAAHILEQHIVAYGEIARAEGRLEGITEAVEKAEAAARRTKGSGQQTGAAKVLSAVRGLLPPQAAITLEIKKAQDRGYRRGYRAAKQSHDSRERTYKRER